MPSAASAYRAGHLPEEWLDDRVLGDKRLRGLSRVLGNSHARFLGGPGAEMPPGYPAGSERLSQKMIEKFEDEN